MGARIGDIQQAVVPRLRQARRVAITAGAVGAGVVIIGGVAVVTLAARRRRRRRGMRHRAEVAADAAVHPGQTVKKGKAVVEELAADTRERIKAELREELKKELELENHQPTYQKVLSSAARTAATTAIPIIIRQLEKRAAR
jgi:hypothetical protein